MSPALPMRLQDRIETPVARLLAAAQVEHRLREALDLVLDALDEVGHAVDDGVEQAGHDGGAGGARRIALLDALQVERKRLGLGVADGDQAVAGEDEGDGRRLRDRRLDVVDDRRRHEVGAALLIEAVGGLDLAHLGARRDVDGQRVLGELVFLDGRLQQVDPYGIAGQRRARLMYRQPFAVRVVDRHHALELRRQRRSRAALVGASYARSGARATAAKGDIGGFSGAVPGSFRLRRDRCLKRGL